jgi:POT family proton-dependent oligopeptide transporter
VNTQKHPKGLYVLFFTEMWERFSFYGMRALLVLYMTQYLLVDPVRARSVIGYDYIEKILFSLFGQLNVQQVSSHLYGWYQGFVYLTPIFGGIIADRYLGRYRSVYVGGILMAIGHFLMAIESGFLIALLFIIMGCGFFKPNISTQVGELYGEDDPRRDSAFTLFYMGINLGAFFSPLVCGTLGQKIGWHYGFGAAGVGMIIGLITYHFGRQHLPVQVIARQQANYVKEPLTAREWQRVGILLLLCVLSAFFWAVNEQQGNTLQLWAEEKTRWTFFGIDVPSSYYQSFNPFMIFACAPLLTQLWAWQASRKREPNSVNKMGIAMFLLASGFIIMMIAGRVVTDDAKGSLHWLTWSTLLATLGELYISPIGLSLVTKVAPQRVVSTMMGVWFLSYSLGDFLAGWLGSYYSIMSKDKFFAMLTMIAFVAGIIFFAVRKPVAKVVGHDV